MEGIRDIGLLQSAIAMPQASFSGEMLHKDLFEMAAAYRPTETPAVAPPLVLEDRLRLK